MCLQVKRTVLLIWARPGWFWLDMLIRLCSTGWSRMALAGESGPNGGSFNVSLTSFQQGCSYGSGRIMRDRGRGEGEGEGGREGSRRRRRGRSVLSLLLHSVGHSKSQGQPILKE